jgi:ferredoxin
MSDRPAGTDADEGDRCGVVYVHVGSEDPDTETAVLAAPEGATLRDVLRDAGYSPYTRVTERANCGGRGLCATCGVRIDDGPDPEHWHDALAARWGYPRLSCQVTLDGDVRVRIPEKVLWGGREP